MVIVPFSTDLSDTGLLRPKISFGGSRSAVVEEDEVGVPLATFVEPEWERHAQFLHIRSQLSFSVKVSKAKAIGRKHNTAAFIFMFLQSVLPVALL
ncbi:hypothetical protein NL676_025418 [Syzygium grande]|nr:hypothetical protein NL676_025418 [Syzygium grande]